MDRRIVTRASLLLFLVAGAAFGAGWYYSERIKNGAFVVDRTPPTPDLIVAAIGNNRIGLRSTAITDVEFGPWRAPGLWGLESDGGYATVGEIVEVRHDEVVRVFTPVKGSVSVGDHVRLEGTTFDGDPLSARGLPYKQVTFQSELGPLGAWRLDGSSQTWLLSTHGQGTSGEGALRFLPTFVKAGLPVLIIEYRNDVGAPPSASGYYDYGETEWRDLEAAVRYALDEGAKDVVLAGYSMGGAITLSFLYRSEFASSVRAVILDAPMLDFEDVVDYGAERLGLPSALTWLAKRILDLRFEFSWEDRNYLRRAAELRVPILLFHGDADRLVHVRTSEALAKARPDLVTYVRVSGATHVRSWNMNPTAYERTLADFLGQHLK